MNLFLQISQKKQIAFVTLAYFITAFAVLFYYGVNSDGEAFKYLLDAKSIADGRSLKYGEFSYFFITYSLLLSFFVKYKISLLWVGMLQILLSYLAAYNLYKLILSRSSHHNISLLIFVGYLFCYPIQKWVFYIYSEGIHTSLVVIGFCVLVNLLHKYSAKYLLYFIALAIAIITTRPVGILFLLAAYLTFMYSCYTKKQHKIVWLSILAGIVLFTAVLNSPVRYFINPDSLKRMEIICMVPQDGIIADYSQFNRTGLLGAFKVIKNDIGYLNFIKTGFKKLGLFFGFVRPYYSLQHNLLLATNWLLYPLAFVGIFCYKQRQFKTIKVFSITILLITAAGIFVTCDDWSNRFIAPVFCFVIILAGMGIIFIQNNKQVI